MPIPLTGILVRIRTILVKMVGARSRRQVSLILQVLESNGDMSSYDILEKAASLDPWAFKNMYFGILGILQAMESSGQITSRIEVSKHLQLEVRIYSLAGRQSVSTAHPAE